jgi:hypothetical protein
VYKDDVVIKKIDIQNQQKELYQESDEESNKATVVRCLIVIVYFKKVSIHLLIAHVHNHDKKEVKTGAEPVPGY